MKHPSLNRNSAILINIILILILTISIISSSYFLKRNVQINNNEDMNKISNEIIGNIDQSRIINADNEPHNWLAHGRDYNEQRFSPLSIINKENISNLELEWPFKFKIRNILLINYRKWRKSLFIIISSMG